MMRRGGSWGAAVRTQDGTIATTSRVLPENLDRWRRFPLLRGVVALGETAVLEVAIAALEATLAADRLGPGTSVDVDGAVVSPEEPRTEGAAIP